MITKESKVRFTLTKNAKTSIIGTVKSVGFKFAYVEIKRVAGRFAKDCQKNIVCVAKNTLEAI